MSALRRRLTVLVGVAVALAIAVPSVLLVRADADRRAEALDAQVRLSARDITAIVGEGEEAGALDVEAYQQVPRAPGAPLTAVVGDDGAQVVADRQPGDALLDRALVLSDRDESDPVDAPGDVRLVALPIIGEDDQIGTAMAWSPLQPLRDRTRELALRTAVGAIAGWLLVCGAAFVLIGRAVRPTDLAVAREQAFLADAAHELRTPWAIVRGRAEQAQRDGVRDEDLRVIVATAQRAGDTITDMLELARLDAGRAMVVAEPLRLDALVATCLDERADEASRRAVRVRLDAPDRVVVPGDERLLARAIGNLLDNALRHGGEGGVLRVAVRERPEGGAEIEVEDRGPGIPPGQVDRVFDRFHRGAGATAGGAGLGLPIVQLVARAHGGEVTVHDAAPGARFVLRLPR
ncbi:sensor histidine kinase [Paraconexibacter algicola]|uniref:sensor histidine kinase n=1 Tax=Paraconexibacter algicola TaxID=2133960 RepID=UPI0011B1E273|nr:ATP-binding protein [Paraconexibacter algicola]